MAVDLSDYAPALRREITPLGSNDYASVTDDQLVQYLADAFWDARLDGFLVNYAADTDGIVSPTSGNADISRDHVSLIVLYAAAKITRNRILNTPTSFTAKAGDVEYQRQNAATVLSEILKQIRATQDRLLLLSDTFAAATDIGYIDAYAARQGYHGYIAPADGPRALGA